MGSKKTKNDEADKAEATADGTEEKEEAEEVAVGEETAEGTNE